jgi:hypothetical protein
MPGGKHLKGVGKKDNRMYAHVKSGYLKKGLSAATAKRRAAMTVNAYRSRKKRKR